ncbi:MAG: enoyl-CoA hydratase/isomerase family protein [Acidobacteriaceae bacterium]
MELPVAYAFETLACTVKQGVLFATVNNPPCNVLSLRMVGELSQLCKAIATDERVRVLVLQSLDAAFFIAHFDTPVVLAKPSEPYPQRPIELSRLQEMCVALRTNPKPSLVKLAGRAGGGGSEIAAACDMRFGVREKTVINQMEVPLGLIPGATGSHTLPQLIGRGRALEMILGGDDIDAQTLHSWGYLNRVFDTVEAMGEFVDALAMRIAKWPPHAVSLAKWAVANNDPRWREALLSEQWLANQASRNAMTTRLLQQFMALGGHTREGEARMADLLVEVAAAAASDSLSY